MRPCLWEPPVLSPCYKYLNLFWLTFDLYGQCGEDSTEACVLIVRNMKPTRTFSFLCRLLEELMVSLQWGRQQTYYPSAQPYTTTELASVNCKLAKAVSSHLLGNVGTSSPKKTSTAVEFCNTPAEKMAERVRTLHITQSFNTAQGQGHAFREKKPCFVATASYWI